MSAQEVGVLPLSFPPPGVNVERHLAIAWNGRPATTPGQVIAGFASTPTDGYESFLVITGLTAIALAGAAISEAVTYLMVDDTSRLVPWTTGNSIAAVRMPCASVPQVAIAAGDSIEVYVYHDRPQ